MLATVVDTLRDLDDLELTDEFRRLARERAAALRTDR